MPMNKTHDDEIEVIELEDDEPKATNFEILSDEFVEKSIQYSISKDLEKARQILRRIHSR